MSNIQKIGIIGAGSMGTMMAFLFAERNESHHISLFDISEDNVKNAEKLLSSSPLRDRVKTFYNDSAYGPFVKSLGDDPSSRLFVFSIPHGSPADAVISALKPHLKSGDTILDGGNEWYKNTERRQREMAESGVTYIGTGVSGGYQSARHGPSMTPSGDLDRLKAIMPLLETWAAKDQDGKPCVTAIGPGGSGHFVKMVHNGIEQGMLGIVCEAWEIMRVCLGFGEDKMAEVFNEWSKGEKMRNTYLLSIGADIASRRHEKGKHVVEDVQDKVVQDADNSEGTGTWTLIESSSRHVSAPTIAAAHYLRLASSNRKERLQIANLLGEELCGTKSPDLSDAEKEAAVSDLMGAVYAGFLASFIQGMNLISRASLDEEWKLNLAEIIRVWRSGCIVQSDHIADLLQGEYQRSDSPAIQNILLSETVASEVREFIPPLKATVKRGIDWDAHIPTLTASLEYFKYAGAKQLPTQFMEAELDYFGAHSYDLKSEGPGDVKKGKHHYEWKPA